jgi:hypothetical protein
LSDVAAPYMELHTDVIAGALENVTTVMVFSPEVVIDPPDVTNTWPGPIGAVIAAAKYGIIRVHGMATTASRGGQNEVDGHHDRGGSRAYYWHGHRGSESRFWPR